MVAKKAGSKSSRKQKEDLLFDDVAKKAADATAGTADSQHIMRARAEALQLYRALLPLNLLPAETYVQEHPPTPGAIAFLAFLAKEIYVRSEASRRASYPRKQSLAAQIRAHGIEKYSEVEIRAPDLYEKYSKRRLTDAISKVKRGKKSP